MLLNINGDFRHYYNFRGDRTCKRLTPLSPTATIERDVDIEKLCYPGTHQAALQYHIWGTFKPGYAPNIAGPRFDDRIADQDADESVPLKCNEDAAWRYVATRPSSPSATLGRALKAAGAKPPGIRTWRRNKGFAAHHMVAANMYIRNAPVSQTYAYACGIEPNAYENGVWLRGSRLKKQGEGNPPLSADSSAYGRLPDAGKSTAYHPAVHTTTYFNTLATRLQGFIETNVQCSDPGGMRAALGDGTVTNPGVRGLLKKNEFPFGPLPGSDAPPNQD